MGEEEGAMPMRWDQAGKGGYSRYSILVSAGDGLSVSQLVECPAIPQS